MQMLLVPVSSAAGQSRDVLADREIDFRRDGSGEILADFQRLCRRAPKVREDLTHVHRRGTPDRRDDSRRQEETQGLSKDSSERYATVEKAVRIY